MKLSKNAILVIISTVVLLVCVTVNYLESKSDERHTVIITPNQSETSQGEYSEEFNETTEYMTAVSSETEKRKTSESSKTTAQSSSQETETALKFSFPADINTASFDMLCAVPGIGEVTADKILSYRESINGFKSMYELLNVSGIGEKKLELLMEYFYVVNDSGGQSVFQTTTASQTAQAYKTSTSRVSTYKTTAAIEASAERVRRMVNINTADAKELEESLLISPEMAEEIVEVRELISGYTNIRELMMVKNFTAALLVEVDEYLLL